MKRFFAERAVVYTDRDVTVDERAVDDLRHLLHGRVMTPTIVVGDEVLLGFAANRERLEALFPRREPQGQG